MGGFGGGRLCLADSVDGNKQTFTERERDLIHRRVYMAITTPQIQ